MDKPKMYKVRYIGTRRGETAGVGIMEPGEEKIVNEHTKDYLLNGWFELVEEVKEQPKTRKVKPGCKKKKQAKEV